LKKASLPSLRRRPVRPAPEAANLVTFRIDDRTVAIPATDRDRLLDHANQLPHGLLGDLCRRIEAAGSSRPIEIHRVEELDALSDFLHDWVTKERVSQGIRDLNHEVKAHLDRLLGAPE
jgi:hypothetical protein